MKKLLVLIVTLAMLSCSIEPEMYQNIIPKPVKLIGNNGSFEISEDVKIKTSQSIEGSNNVAEFLTAEMKKVLNWDIETINELNDNAKLICLSKIQTKNDLGKEGYVLIVTADSIVIKANEANGLFYGVQTLIQTILPYTEQVKANGILKMPCVNIEDKPNLEWRGLHLDVSRHFFDMDFVKKYIDVMAFHKLNVFHWHLTDDQGWRIEIKKYPKLTEIGAWREYTGDEWSYEIRPYIDNTKQKYGGYYTQDDIKEIIQYAKDRHIEVVPEIEMPGHSWFVLYAYPELSCTGIPFKKSKDVSFEFTDPFCAGNEKTFEFFEDVLSEVIDLFPFEYIHIGGDECKKIPWEKCGKCQKRMNDEGLDHVEDLQSYFIKRIEKFVNSKGKQIIGWDEILEGGLAPGAAVMSWTGIEGGIEAAKQKHKVVMTPSQYVYFKSDYQFSPSTVSLEKTYNYNPVPDELSDEEKEFVIGVEGCIWTETSPNNTIAFEKLLPRLTALSEIAWLEDDVKDYQSYIDRMEAQLKRYDLMGWHYYIHAPVGLENEEVYYKDEHFVEITSELKGVTIRFTTDNSEPTEKSQVYTSAIEVDEKTILKAKSFLPNGLSSITRTGTYKKDILRETVSIENPVNGLRLKIYDGTINTLDEIATLSLIKEGYCKSIAIPDSMTGDYYALEFNGYIKIDKEGLYTFTTRSDDGSRFYINDELIVDNDGIHGAKLEKGKVPLKEGFYKLKLEFFEGNYGQSLEVMIAYEKEKPEAISESVLFN